MNCELKIRRETSKRLSLQRKRFNLRKFYNKLIEWKERGEKGGLPEHAKVGAGAVEARDGRVHLGDGVLREARINVTVDIGDALKRVIQ